ncbi:DgyrCDS12943 [Dimorphilus gyrociliatus]|uniref:DgyrCDS12943 n=1 Tax=Dimorphilus gyrociliatus TaxID=2664684 RepID=A0A7I8W976_9ANNE|nr:DgyrCDS12943 [Dimorphilus gyrociliatus]
MHEIKTGKSYPVITLNKTVEKWKTININTNNYIDLAFMNNCEITLQKFTIPTENFSKINVIANVDIEIVISQCKEYIIKFIKLIPSLVFVYNGDRFQQFKSLLTILNYPETPLGFIRAGQIRGFQPFIFTESNMSNGLMGGSTNILQFSKITYQAKEETGWLEYFLGKTPICVFFENDSTDTREIHFTFDRAATISSVTITLATNEKDGNKLIVKQNNGYDNCNFQSSNKNVYVFKCGAVKEANSNPQLSLTIPYGKNYSICRLNVKSLNLGLDGKLKNFKDCSANKGNTFLFDGKFKKSLAFYNPTCSQFTIVLPFKSRIKLTNLYMQEFIESQCQFEMYIEDVQIKVHCEITLKVSDDLYYLQIGSDEIGSNITFYNKKEKVYLLEIEIYGERIDNISSEKQSKYNDLYFKNKIDDTFLTWKVSNHNLDSLCLQNMIDKDNETNCLMRTKEKHLHIRNFLLFEYRITVIRILLTIPPFISNVTDDSLINSFEVSLFKQTTWIQSEKQTIISEFNGLKQEYLFNGSFVIADEVRILTNFHKFDIRIHEIEVYGDLYRRFAKIKSQLIIFSDHSLRIGALKRDSLYNCSSFFQLHQPRQPYTYNWITLIFNSYVRVHSLAISTKTNLLNVDISSAATGLTLQEDSVKYFPLSKPRRVCKTFLNIPSPGTFVSCHKDVVGYQLTIASLNSNEMFKLCHVKIWGQMTNLEEMSLLRMKRFLLMPSISQVLKLDTISTVTHLTISAISGPLYDLEVSMLNDETKNYEIIYTSDFQRYRSEDMVSTKHIRGRYISLKMNKKTEIGLTVYGNFTRSRQSTLMAKDMTAIHRVLNPSAKSLRECSDSCLSHAMTDCFTFVWESRGVCYISKKAITSGHSEDLEELKLNYNPFLSKLEGSTIFSLHYSDRNNTMNCIN